MTKVICGGAPPGGGDGFEALHGLSAAQRATIAPPLAEAFASTFVWALALLAVAFIPAVAIAIRSRGEAPPAAAPQVALE